MEVTRQQQLIHDELSIPLKQKSNSPFTFEIQNGHSNSTSLLQNIKLVLLRVYTDEYFKMYTIFNA